jgi:hypothetical protein
VLNVLAELNTDINTMSGLIKTVQIDTQFKQFTLDFIDKVIASAFQPPKKLLLENVQSVLQQPEETKFILDKALAELKTSFLEKSFVLLQRFVDSKLAYLSENSNDNDDNNSSSGAGSTDTAYDGVLDKMTAGFEHFWSSLGDELKSYTQHHTDLNKHPLPKPLLLLVMSRSALDMSASLIEPLFGAFYVAVVKKGSLEAVSLVGSATTTSPTSPYGMVGASGGGGGLSPKRSKQGDPRKHLLVVTATGGTVASASTSYIGGSGRRGQQTGGGGSGSGSSSLLIYGVESADELSGRAADLYGKGKDVASCYKTISQVRFNYFRLM